MSQTDWPEGVQVLTPEEVNRAMELAKGPLHPEIAKLQSLLDSEMRAQELRATVTGQISEEKIKMMVKMKLFKDVLYVQWSKGNPLPDVQQLFDSGYFAP